MLHKVVVPFPCSWDGFTLVDLVIGDERDFGSMADGLVAAGWIAPASAEQTGEPQAIEPAAPASTTDRRGK